MKAFTNTTFTKDEILTRLAAHRAADQLVQGYGYWKDGKGCAVGCTIHSDHHANYEPAMGIPQALARLEDCIFEGLPSNEARLWPEAFISAIHPGADLSLVVWKFLHEVVSETVDKHGTKEVKAGCAAAIEVLRLKADGKEVAAAYAAASAAAAAAAWSRMAKTMLRILSEAKA